MDLAILTGIHVYTEFSHQSRGLMKRISTTLVLCLVTAFVSAASTRPHSAPSAAPPSTRRQVTVTFDDLPVVSVTRIGDDAYHEITTKLVATITRHKVPAIGFVNERKLYRGGDNARDEARVALLRAWTTAGLELGNHTYSHPDLHTTPLAAFQEDVIRGEAVTTMLLGERARKLRYFRHPFLHTGRDLTTKNNFEVFLAARGYRVAPVTIDNSDWIFASAYAKATERGDTRMMKRIADAYVPYMEEMFEFFEKLSIDIVGYEAKQVLLLHANALNADHFDRLAQMMRRRGYTFITLDEALRDKVYALPDTFTGAGGLSWLHRWARTKGMARRDEPDTPEFVMRQAGVTVE